MKRKVMLIGALRLGVLGAAIGLSACGGGGSGGTSADISSPSQPPPGTTPSSVDFTAFVKDQWEVQPTDTPTEVDGVSFNFEDNDNPHAYDDMLDEGGA